MEILCVKSTLQQYLHQKICDYFQTIMDKIAEEWGHCLLSCNLSVSIEDKNKL